MSEYQNRADSFFAVDIGNTNIDAAFFRNCSAALERWEAEARIKIPRSEADGLADALSEYFNSVPDGAIIGSVAEGFSQIAADAVESVFGLAPVVADCGMETGLEIAYENPQDLGIDRIANASAVFARKRQNCIAVDLGTATTFDCVSADGRYLGGAIAAGLESFGGNLSQKIPALPETPFEFPPSVIGTNTADCIKSGTMFGYARMVDGMVRSLWSETVSDAQIRPRVVATGGFAPVLSGECETFSETDTLLTLKGLVVILLKNEKILSL